MKAPLPPSAERELRRIPPREREDAAQEAHLADHRGNSARQAAKRWWKRRREIERNERSVGVDLDSPSFACGSKR